MPTLPKKHKHPTVREEERVELVNKAQDEIWEYNERYSDTCCRCQVKLKVGGGRHEANHILSCASCIRSAHEYGCAKEAELVHGQYWKRDEFRASYRKIHPAFENIHKKKKSKLNFLNKWDMKNGSKHDSTTEQKRCGETQNEKRTDLREPTNTTGAIWGRRHKPDVHKKQRHPNEPTQAHKG